MSLYTITFRDAASRQIGRVTFEPNNKPHGRSGEIVLVEGGKKFADEWAAVIAGHSDRTILAGWSYVGPVRANDWLHVAAAAAELRRRRPPGRRPSLHVDGPTLDQIGIEIDHGPAEADH